MTFFNRYSRELIEPKELKKTADRLMGAALRSKTECTVSLRSGAHREDRPKEDVAVEITFFKNENGRDTDNFSLTLYQFFSADRNRALTDQALTLMKHPERYDEIKQWAHDQRS